MLVIDKETLIHYGVIRTPVVEDTYQNSGVPLYRLLDGPRLKAMWAETEAKYAERFKDLPAELRSAPSDIISVSINPYSSEQTARDAMRVLFDRIKATEKARPWSIELYANVECSIIGLLGAPFFIFLGITEISGIGTQETYKTIKQVVSNLHTDCRAAMSGGEWEIYSQSQGNQWRRDRCARLLERWVFLDVDVVRSFGAQQS